MEALGTDVGGDLGSPATGVRTLLDQDETPRVLDRFADPFTVPRDQGAQIDDASGPGAPSAAVNAVRTV